MIDIALAVAIAIAALLSGVVGGILLNYFTDSKPLRASYSDLVHTLTQC